MKNKELEQRRSCSKEEKKRFENHVSKASVRLAELIIEDDAFSELKIVEIDAAIERAQKLLHAMYKQISLRQAKDCIESLSEDEVIYDCFQVLR